MKPKYVVILLSTQLYYYILVSDLSNCKIFLIDVGTLEYSELEVISSILGVVTKICSHDRGEHAELPYLWFCQHSGNFCRYRNYLRSDMTSETDCILHRWVDNNTCLRVF